MQKILTAAEMRRDDEAKIQSGTPSRVLMERAAEAVLQILQKEFDTRRVLVLCGSGNNGGDGFALARMLRESGSAVSICYPGKTLPDGHPDPAAMSEECARQYTLLPDDVSVTVSPLLEGITAVVDALLGIGLSRPVEGAYAAAIEAVNAASLPVLAVDIPSGVHTDTGAILGTAIRATKTVAIAAKKRGHLLYPGAMLCGEVEIVEIGIPVGEAAAHVLEKSDLSALPSRPRRAHKGTFGRVLIVGGSVGMAGAPYLAGKAAYRAGCGIVELLAPEENRIIHQIQLPEAVLTCYTEETSVEALRSAMRRANAVAIGMGLGQSPLAAALTEIALQECAVPLLVDADALNLIAASSALTAALYRRSAPTVITPHLGEMSRLLGFSIPKITGNLIGTASTFSKAAGVVTVLKDAHTVISDSVNHYLNVLGNSGMATGGSGDVLAGIITSLLAQGATPLCAASLGVLLHARAGDAAAEMQTARSIMASDLIQGLCHVFE
ncbi:MAG: NAD(P)H-hydrate dehydratase [Clostridia bacterium]|nr:NAD(P)H-hydrate dehydratase [Clostridia bacterium]